MRAKSENIATWTKQEASRPRAPILQTHVLASLEFVSGRQAEGSGALRASLTSDMVFKGAHQWGVAVCAAALALVAISEIGNETDLSLQDVVRVAESATYNQIFELEETCDAKCVEHVISRLQYALGCYEPEYKSHLHVIEGTCKSISSLSAYQIGEIAMNGMPAIKAHYNNSILHLPPAEESKPVSNHPNSARWLEMSADLPSVSRMEHEVGVKYWNLDRIDQKEGWSASGGLDGIFDDKCFPKQGTGVTVYVIDTGCEANHEELIGRTLTYSKRYSTGDDDNGHGTHVAGKTHRFLLSVHSFTPLRIRSLDEENGLWGLSPAFLQLLTRGYCSFLTLCLYCGAGIAAGTYSGVCKKCQVVCIKALGRDGGGTSGDIVDAIEQVLEEHAQQPRGSPAVAVMSIGGLGGSTLFDRAVESLSKEGVIPVVAASNYAQDACDYTPARSPFAVTVGASTIMDRIFGQSNRGSCIDIMAPGHSINSASHRSTTACMLGFFWSTIGFLCVNEKVTSPNMFALFLLFSPPCHWI